MGEWLHPFFNEPQGWCWLLANQNVGWKGGGCNSPSSLRLWGMFFGLTSPFSSLLSGRDCSKAGYWKQLMWLRSQRQIRKAYADFHDLRIPGNRSEHPFRNIVSVPWILSDTVHNGNCKWACFFSLKTFYFITYPKCVQPELRCRWWSISKKDKKIQ